MAITLTIQLSDELEQQVIVQAKQQQVSPESIVLQSLSQTLITSQPQIEAEATFPNLEDSNVPPALRAAFQNLDSPNSQEPVQALLTLRQLYSNPETSHNTLATSVIIAEIINRVREAKLAGQTSTEFPAMSLTLYLAQVMVEGGLISRFNLIGEGSNGQLQLEWEPETESNKLPQTWQNAWREENKKLPEDLLTALENLKSENPLERVQAVTTLGDLYRDSK